MFGVRAGWCSCPLEDSSRERRFPGWEPYFGVNLPPSKFPRHSTWLILHETSRRALLPGGNVQEGEQASLLTSAKIGTIDIVGYDEHVGSALT